MSKNDPYSHFNSANSDCFQKLFEGVEDHDNEDNEANNNLPALNNLLINNDADEDAESEFEYNPADFEDSDDDDDDGIVFR